MNNEQNRFIRYLMRHGVSITATQIAGDACPCISNNRSVYSAQWHADNPSADDCNKTGVINSTTTNTSIKAMLTFDANTLTNFLGIEAKGVIGEIQKGEVIMYGQCDTDGDFFDVSEFSERRDYLTYDSIEYFVRDNFKIDFTNNVGQVSILRIREA